MLFEKLVQTLLFSQFAVSLFLVSAFVQSSGMQSEDDILTQCLRAAEKQILSVGSGDGSQQKGMVERGLRNIQVTFYDSKAVILRKCPNANAILEYLKKHCTHPPKYQVDATKLDQLFPAESFDLIMFTFPHTGIPNNDPKNIESNQRLLRNFLKSASVVLKKEGEIQITLKNGQHYDQWKLPELLDQSMRLKFRSTHDFDPSMFPGYQHRLTRGVSGNLKVVPNKDGAKVYTFGPDVPLRETNSPFYGKYLTIVALTRDKEWADDELRPFLVDVLEQSQQPQDVLELRRQFPQPLPDTRQLNRILYGMEKDKTIQRHSPLAERNSKPRWSLLE